MNHSTPAVVRAPRYDTKALPPWIVGMSLSQTRAIDLRGSSGAPPGDLQGTSNSTRKKRLSLALHPDKAPHGMSQTATQMFQRFGNMWDRVVDHLVKEAPREGPPEARDSGSKQQAAAAAAAAKPSACEKPQPHAVYKEFFSGRDIVAKLVEACASGGFGGADDSTEKQVAGKSRHHASWKLPTARSKVCGPSSTNRGTLLPAWGHNYPSLARV